MKRIRSHGCYRTEAEGPLPHPWEEGKYAVCGYTDSPKDPACFDCARNPATERLREIRKAVEESAESWARRWGVG